MPELVRCPVCRTVVEATDDEVGGHLRTHSTWKLFLFLWDRDRQGAVTVAGVLAILVMLAILIGLRSHL